ncbi:MAG: hypothetical protein ABI981_04165 [Betaproteobacteria bacterium]
MRERRRLTLLQLAILSSAAVVPVLLAVLLSVASARQADGAKPAPSSDRHVSVRLVAALKTFEYAIVRRDEVRALLPSAATLLERVPQCRAAWDGRGGVLSSVRRILARSSDDGRSTALRMSTQLDEIDRALQTFSSGDNRRVSDRVGLDSRVWFDAVSTALSMPIESPDYPGVRFTVQCADIASAVATLARSNGRMLSTLSWRGTEVERVLSRWRPDQFVEIAARNVARFNPWAGLPGCIYLGNTGRAADAGEDSATYFLAGTRGQDDRQCKRPEMRGIAALDAPASAAIGITAGAFGTPADDRWKIPPSLDVMLQPLEALRRASGSIYAAQTTSPTQAQGAQASPGRGPNRIDVGGTPVDVGFSIDLTIDPSLQALAQQTAACYTGRDDVCRALGMQRKEDGAQAVGHTLLEHAMVRMAAVAIIDVESGRIEALAGALSPCTREEYDGPGRSAHCDKRLPYPIRYHPDALLNPAVFADAMPGSIIKPIMAAAFFSDPQVGARWLAAERAELARAPKALPSTNSVRAQLMRSDSARFLDRMFCADQGFGPCARPWEIQAAAPAFGWNGDCAEPSELCGKRDLLFGRDFDALDGKRVRRLAMPVAYGRLLAEPLAGKLGAPLHVRPPIALDSTRIQRCAAGADGRRLSKDDWGKCSGGVVVDIVAEGWGQGHARASALGAAGMMAMLAAAANGQTQVRAPHLIEAVHGTGATDSATLGWSVADAQSNAIPHDVAEVIISGLSFSHRAGTARLACEQVFDPRTCAQMDWIAGKTGTPTFPNDERSLDDLALLCAAAAAQPRRDRDACGPLRPYKWYVAAYRSRPDDARWNKVIGVLTERNWLADTGRVHGAGDHGPNPAAEIAMQIVGRHAGALAQPARVAQGAK